MRKYKGKYLNPEQLGKGSQGLCASGLGLLGLEIGVGVNCRRKEAMEPGKESIHMNVLDRFDHASFATGGRRVDLGDPIEVLDKSQVILGSDESV
jgi:hypothetical protein